ncbi:Hypothetical_protein [Hexamita inflata]|uniref:Hypothetical_protein n=1 Tax=Hexamita inflata TaxID=28002 RepID=A0AA86NE66_9EUKA|nr:Hypothetical protein HINF_LOCUS5767 [Hexamita inflata]CAI9940068.1 Hypothetical protein HINF_LOCUS27713 [Hexamita inflata]
MKISLDFEKPTLTKDPNETFRNLLRNTSQDLFNKDYNEHSNELNNLSNFQQQVKMRLQQNNPLLYIERDIQQKQIDRFRPVAYVGQQDLICKYCDNILQQGYDLNCGCTVCALCCQSFNGTVVSEPTLILTNVYVIIALENQITVFMLIITYSINSAVHFFFTSSFK